MEITKCVYSECYMVRKLIVPVYPSPKGSRDNQFAPFRVGVNEFLPDIQAELFRIKNKKRCING